VGGNVFCVYVYVWDIRFLGMVIWNYELTFQKFDWSKLKKIFQKYFQIATKIFLPLQYLKNFMHLPQLILTTWAHHKNLNHIHAPDFHLLKCITMFMIATLITYWNEYLKHNLKYFWKIVFKMRVDVVDFCPLFRKKFLVMKLE
jgi:hypothetical protein